MTDTAPDMPAPRTSAPRPVVLCILDGWGLAPEGPGNAVALAETPVFDRLMRECPHATLVTHGRDAGLPAGQMGNSEVGHTNIGAGRVVAMDLGAIDLALEDGSFDANPALADFIAALRESGGTAHLIGLVSDGGVHAHIDHLLAAARHIAGAGVPVAVHALTDGRDVPPTSAAGFLDRLARGLPEGARIATVTGRYWAMDRDRRWDRVERAFRAIVGAEGARAGDAATAVAMARLGKTVSNQALWAWEYSTMPRQAAHRGRSPASKAANAGSASAARISRARSARKLRQKSPSPSRAPA